MTDDEIIKALELCGHCPEVCKKCPLSDEDENCSEILIKECFGFVKRQRAEIEQKDTEIDILIRKKETLKDEVSELRSEIERLRGLIMLKRTYSYQGLE